MLLHRGGPHTQAITTGGIYNGMCREAITGRTTTLAYFRNGGRASIIAENHGQASSSTFDLGHLQKNWYPVLPDLLCQESDKRRGWSHMRRSLLRLLGDGC